MSPTAELSALDATFLELEDADPTAHMHIGGMLIFDPLPNGKPPTLARLRRHVDRRLDALPRYRQKLSRRRTGRLHRPRWEPDERFDVATHVTRAALPAPGGERELLEWAGDFWSHRVDRARPLWRVVLLEGLSEGRWAMATKTHHCLVDGVGAVDVSNALLDPAPHTRRAAARPRPDLLEEDDGSGWLRRLAAMPIAATGAAVDAVRHPADTVATARGMTEVLVRDELIAAPRASINVRLSEHRRLAVADVSLRDLKTIGRRLGGTVNDVVLALVTAGLRELLLSRGEAPPPAGLRAMVPVNLRAAAEHMELGNRVTSLFVHLPVAAEDPEARLQGVRTETARLKAGHQAEGGRALMDLAGLAPPVLHSLLARTLFATRLFNVTVTNIPGPPDRLFVFGAPMRRAIPLVPLAAEHAVGVAAFSYAGEICVCVHADRDAVPDVARVTDGVLGELRVLRALAGGAGVATA